MRAAGIACCMATLRGYCHRRRVTLKHCAGQSVVVDVAERRQIIRKALDAATRTVAGARWREDEALVETVGAPDRVAQRDPRRL